MDPIHCKTVDSSDYCWVQDITGVYLQPFIQHYLPNCSSCAADNKNRETKLECNEVDLVFKLFFNASKPFEPHFLNTHNKSENALSGDALFLSDDEPEDSLSGLIYMSD